MIDVSIIIVNYNTRDLIVQLIESIFANTKKIEFEIIVVDNHSTDGSVGLLREKFSGIKIIENDSNFGYARANNQAFKEARGEKIFLLNSDTFLLDESISKMVDFLDSEDGVGIVGCQLLNDDESIQLSCGVFPSLWGEMCKRLLLNRIFPRSKIFDGYKLGYWDYSEKREVDWLTGAAFMTRRKLLDDIVGFDEAFFMFYEDADFCRRAKLAGWKVYFFPDAAIKHLWGGAWKKERGKIILANCKSTLYYFKKHHPRWHTGVLKMILIIESLMRIIIAAIMFIFSPSRRLLSRERISGYGKSLSCVIFGH